MDKQMIEEIARTTCNYNAKNFESCVECTKGGLLSCDRLVQAEKIYNAGYRKIPEGAVVLKKDEAVDLFNSKASGFMTSAIGDIPLNIDGMRKVVDEISRLSIVEAELQELNAKYYNEAKDLRRELKRVRKETAEKFADRLKEKLNEWLEDNEDLDGKINFGIAQIELIGVKSLDGEIIAESLIEEICKEITDKGVQNGG